MASNHDLQLKGLDKKITELSDTLARLGKDKTLKDLLRVIRNPGWTTPAELAFAHGVVDLLAHQAAGLAQGIEGLAAASKKVAG